MRKASIRNGVVTRDADFFYRRVIDALREEAKQVAKRVRLGTSRRQQGIVSILFQQLASCFS